MSKEIVCLVDNQKCCFGICKKCEKFSQESIKEVFEQKKEAYYKTMGEFNDFFESYNCDSIPTCKYGYTDCIYDEGYIKENYPNWYKELCCKDTYNPTDWCEDCIDGSEYDNEDK